MRRVGLGNEARRKCNEPTASHSLEEAGLDLAGAAESNVSAREAGVAVAEDLGVVGLEGLGGGSAVDVPDVDTLERNEHSARKNRINEHIKGIKIT